MLSDKIKTLRKQANLSQEQLAEKLQVSRQAVTKWENGGGVPDIDNLRAVAGLFQVSLDELLANERLASSAPEYLYESVTEYDIDSVKSFDITLAGAHSVKICGYDGEKIQVRLASNQIADIQSAFKVKIDDIKTRIDVEMRRFEAVSERMAKEALLVFIRLPQRYLKEVEIAGNMLALEMCQLQAQRLEFTGKTPVVRLEGVSGRVELNGNVDMAIECKSLSGQLDVNQISAASKIFLPQDTAFLAVVRGIANHIYYEREGRPCADFSLSAEEASGCENVIELNGMKSELIISAVAQPPAEVRS